MQVVESKNNKCLFRSAGKVNKICSELRRRILSWLQLASSFLSSRYSLNFLFYSKTFYFFLTFIIKHFIFSRDNSSLERLSIFAKNLKLVRCSWFLLFISRPNLNMNTYNFLHCSARITYLVCVTRKFKYVLTYRATNICLTHFPSDTLPLFR